MQPSSSSLRDAIERMLREVHLSRYIPLLYCLLPCCCVFLSEGRGEGEGSHGLFSSFEDHLEGRGCISLRSFLFFHLSLLAIPSIICLFFFSNFSL